MEEKSQIPEVRKGTSGSNRKRQHGEHEERHAKRSRYLTNGTPPTPGRPTANVSVKTPRSEGFERQVPASRSRPSSLAEAPIHQPVIDLTGDDDEDVVMEPAPEEAQASGSDWRGPPLIRVNANTPPLVSTPRLDDIPYDTCFGLVGESLRSWPSSYYPFRADPSTD